MINTLSAQYPDGETRRGGGGEEEEEEKKEEEKEVEKDDKVKNSIMTLVL